MDGNHVGPHEYMEGRPRWAFWRNAFCKCCYHTLRGHPAQTWRRARPIGDTRTAGQVMKQERLAALEAE